MKEAVIRKAVIKELEADGWVCWYAPKVRFHETDVFGVWDVLALKGNKERRIQLTTVSNMSARKKKILTFTEKYDIKVPSEVWGMREDGTFRKIDLK